MYFVHVHPSPVLLFPAAKTVLCPQWCLQHTTLHSHGAFCMPRQRISADFIRKKTSKKVKNETFWHGALSGPPNFGRSNIKMGWHKVDALLDLDAWCENDQLQFRHQDLPLHPVHFSPNKLLTRTVPFWEKFAYNRQLSVIPGDKDHPGTAHQYCSCFNNTLFTNGGSWGGWHFYCRDTLPIC